MLQDFPSALPETGWGTEPVSAAFEAAIAERSARLDDPLAFAHMDPPALELAAHLVGLNARANQNLLHRATSPFATEIEARLIAWLAPVFGMTCGHVCSGSTLANLTGLWCAREAGARRVVASEDAHLSVAKAAHILAMPFEAVPVDADGRLDRSRLAAVEDAALVLTAGTTGRGVIDELEALPAHWTHVDAAWAGPLQLTRYSARLDGIARADSIAISGHKWLFQPKDSALVLFRDPGAQTSISFGGGYLAAANIGVQGSRGAAAIPLFATLLALGRSGLAALIEKNMADAEALAARLAGDPRTELKQTPDTGVVNWRPRTQPVEAVLAGLEGTSSRTRIQGEIWVRQVAANPHADVEKIWERIDRVLQGHPLAGEEG
jgi:L-2,4-diaminobutyrate decarboxylase